MCSLFHDLAWLGVLSRDFAFSFHFLFPIVCLYLFWGIEGYDKGHWNLIVPLPTDTKFHLFFMFLLNFDRNISHGKRTEPHNCSSVIADPTPSMPFGWKRCVGKQRGSPIILHSYWFNSLLMEKLRRNGCQRGKEKTRDSFSPELLIRSSFRVIFFDSPVPEGKITCSSLICVLKTIEQCN